MLHVNRQLALRTTLRAKSLPGVQARATLRAKSLPGVQALAATNNRPSMLQLQHPINQSDPFPFSSMVRQDGHNGQHRQPARALEGALAGRPQALARAGREQHAVRVARIEPHLKKQVHEKQHKEERAKHEQEQGSGNMNR